MKHYEYAGMDVSTEKSVEDGARCYIEAVRTTRSHINEECRASRKCITSTESLWMIARKGNHRVQHGTVNRVSQYGSKFYTSQKGGWLEPPERGRDAD